MADAIPNFYAMYVPELQQYLKARKIRFSGYPKVQLIHMCQEAHRLYLPSTESVDVSTKQVPVGLTWTDELKTIPIMHPCDVFLYFRTACGWTTFRERNYKDDNGFRLHTNGHISCVEMSEEQGGLVYLRAKAVPEERQSQPPYDVWVQVDRNGTINFGGCTCVAGDGTCKHVAALLFGALDFCRKLQDTSVVSVTDQQAKWCQPTRTTVSRKAVEVDLRTCPGGPQRSDPSSELYKPVPVNLSSMENSLFKMIKDQKLEAVAGYGLSDDDSDSDFDFEKYPLNVLDLVEQYHTSADAQTVDLTDYLSHHLQGGVSDEILKLSTAQSRCNFWMYQRLGRVTASIFHEAAHFQSFCNFNASLLKKIFGELSGVDNVQTRHGKKYEEVAIKTYCEKYGVDHDGFVFLSTGLHVAAEYPLLGASPDGLISCVCHGDGCVEVKCSYKYKDLEPLEAAKFYPDNFTCGNSISLKKAFSSPFYCQIIGQMALTKRSYCDFIFHTTQGLFVERIPFDQQFWSLELLPKLQHFCNVMVKSRLIKKK